MPDQGSRDGVIGRLVFRIVLRWLARRRRRRLHPQLAVLSADTIGEAVVVNGLYEKQELLALSYWLAQEHPDVLGHVALDVGANIGNHAVFLAGLFRRVVAFEPNPRIFPLLDYNLSTLPQASANNLALSDTAGTSVLSVPQGNMGAAKVHREGTGIPIRLERLDYQDLGEDRVGLIKLDVEGHELNVLIGGSQRIAADRPIVVFEQHGSQVERGTSPVLDWLKAVGYDQFYMVGRPIGPLGKLCPVGVHRIDRLSRRNYPMIVAVAGGSEGRDPG